MKKIISCIISLFFVLNMILPLSIVCAEENTEYECIRLPIISDQFKENVTEDITLYKENDILYVPLHIVCPLLNAYWNVKDGGFIVDRDCISFRYYDENNMKLIIDFERGDEKWNKTDNILLEGNLLSCKKFGVEWCVDFIKFCDMFGATFSQVYQGNIQAVKDKIKTMSEDTTSWNDMDIEKELDFEENPYYIFVYSGTPLSSLYDKVMHNQDVYLWDYSCYEKLNLTDKEDNWFENILQSIKYSNTTTGLKIQSENVFSNVINDDWGVTKILLSPPYRSSEHYKKSLVNISGVNYSSYLNKNDLKTENNSKAEELEKVLIAGTITSSLSTTADNILTKYLNDIGTFGKLNNALDIINFVSTPYQKYCEIDEFHKKLDSINEIKINLLKKSIVENDFIKNEAKMSRLFNETFDGTQIEIPVPEGAPIEIPIPTTTPTKTPMTNIFLNSIDNYEGLMNSSNELCSLYKNSNKQFTEELYKAIESGVYTIGDTAINTVLSESGDPSLALISAIITVYDGFTAWTKNTYGEQLQKSENLVQSYFLEKVMRKDLDIKNPENLYNRLTLMLQSSLCCFEYDEEYFQSNRNSIAKMLYTLDIDTSLNINYYHDPRNNNVDESIKNAILNFDSAKNDDSNYKWYLAPTIEAEDIIVSDNSTDELFCEIKASDTYSVMKQNGKYTLIDYNGQVVNEEFYNEYYFEGASEILLKRDDISPYYLIAYRNNKIYENDFGIGRGESGGYKGFVYDSSNNTIYADKCFGYEIFDKTISYYNANTKEVHIPRAVLVQLANVTRNNNQNYNLYDVELLGKYGMAFNNQITVDTVYDSGRMSLYNDIIALKNGDKWGYFNGQSGNKIIDFKCNAVENNYEYPYVFSDNYVALYTDDGCCYYDIYGNEVISSGTFEEVRPVHNNLAWVKKNGKWGVIKLKEVKITETDNNNNEQETTEDLIIETVKLTNDDIKPEWEHVTSLNLEYPVFKSTDTELQDFLTTSITEKILSYMEVDKDYNIDIYGSFKYDMSVNGYLSVSAYIANHAEGGNGAWTIPYTFFVDLQNKKILSLNDLFSETEDIICKEVAIKADKYNKSHAQHDTLLNYNYKECKFILTKDNLILTFNPYSISVGAEGIINIEIPLTDLDLTCIIS